MEKIALLVLVTLALLCTTGALALLYNNHASVNMPEEAPSEIQDREGTQHDKNRANR